MENNTVPIFITAEIVLKTTSGKSIFTASEEELDLNDPKLFFTSPQVIKEAVTALKQDGFLVQYISRNSITVWGATARFENKFKVKFTSDGEELKINGGESLQFKENSSQELESYKNLLEGIYLEKPSTPLAVYHPKKGTDPPPISLDNAKPDKELEWRIETNYTPEEIPALLNGDVEYLEREAFFGQNISIAVIDNCYQHAYFEKIIENRTGRKMENLLFEKKADDYTEKDGLKEIRKNFREEKIEELLKELIAGINADQPTLTPESIKSKFSSACDQFKSRLLYLVPDNELKIFEKYIDDKNQDKEYSPDELDLSEEEDRAILVDWSKMIIQYIERFKERLFREGSGIGYNPKLKTVYADHGTSMVACILAIAPLAKIKIYTPKISKKDRYKSVNNMIKKAIKDKPDIICISTGNLYENFNNRVRIPTSIIKKRRLLENAVKEKNIIIVQAAGNVPQKNEVPQKLAGYFEPEFPSVITVGGCVVSQPGKVVQASKSSTGYKRPEKFRTKAIPEICGVNGTGEIGDRNGKIVLIGLINTYLCLPIAHPRDLFISEDGWRLQDGTSFCGPQIAGVCALIKQILPGAPPQVVKKILLKTANELDNDESFFHDIPAKNLKNQYGKNPGLANIGQAIAKALKIKEELIQNGI